jgi:hypothetical protein
MSAATSRSSNEATAAESASGYLASEPHYLSVAGRILAALHGERRLVAVAGDPPAGAQLLCQALSKLAGSRHRVIGIPCGPELTGEEVFRAGSVVATLPAGGGMGATSDTGAPLFVFDEADRLSDHQLADICATMQQGTRQNATGVLLGRREFLARLEESPLQFSGEALAARLRFDEIGDDEGIDFLRHQLAVRHSEDETPRVRPILFRGLAVLGVLVAIAGGVSLTLHYLRMTDVKTPEGRSVPSPGSATPSIGPSQPVPRAAPSAAAVPPGGSAKPQSGPASPPPALRPEEMPLLSAPASPAPRGDATPPQAAPGSVQSPPGPRLSPAEIGALINRGDAFLSAGDIASARSFYERAADAGAAAAALRLGATFDPNVLGRAGVRGNPGDPAQAASWYRRARDLGDAAALERLKTLDRQTR